VLERWSGPVAAARAWAMGWAMETAAAWARKTATALAREMG
jgi:hypothetical protein